MFKKLTHIFSRKTLTEANISPASVRINHYSLKRRLLFYLLFSLLLVWGVTAYWSYQKTREEIGELFNAELAQSARVVHSLIETLLSGGSLTEHWNEKEVAQLFPETILGHKYERRIAFQLRSLKDGIILRSESAPPFELSKTRNGYSQETIDGQLWHVFSLSDERGEYVAHVGQRHDLRERLSDTISLQLMEQFLLMPPILGVMIWLVVSRTLQPVMQLKEQLASRAAGFLEPLPLETLPEEIVPVIAQLNRLFSQLEEAFDNERRFTADASHELRTPLAGLLTQVQVAQKTQDEAVRNQALQQAQQAVSRMTRLVQQLLTLARVQHQQTLEQTAVDLQALLIEVISELAGLAYQKQIDVELHYHQAVELNGNPQLLAMLVRNLLENALKYSPEHGKVSINVATIDGRLTLSVEDSGAGIAEDDYPRLTQRFYRGVDTAQQVEGCGLGLSIVQRIAQLHGAGLRFDRSTWGGLKVEVIFCRLGKKNAPTLQF